MKLVNKDLPIFGLRNQILNAVAEYDTVIIKSEAGSGKSTLVPLFLYEAGYIVRITQPRRVAATSLASYVDTLTDTPGVVGFHTGFENNCTEKTRITYCTDGLQLVKSLLGHGSKDMVLIIDEVHEWNINIETLVAWVKRLREDGNNIKTILMSATIDTSDLAEFFDNVPVLEVGGRTFSVEVSQSAADTIKSQVVKFINRGFNTLVFMPGKSEIANLIDELSDQAAVVLPLHGDLSYAEQLKCFQSYGLPKVVVSTNIAQTSVTIADIDAVVDSGFERRVEVIDGLEGLFLRNISQADILQRRGRAGRTKSGFYVLCSDTSFERRAEYSIPEIQRSLLDQVVLRLAAIGFDAADLDFLHQPNKSEIEKAKRTLQKIGAMKGNQITGDGRKIAKMPVSARAGRMILKGNELGVTDDIIALAAILEVGSMVSYRKDEYGDKYSYRNFVTGRGVENDIMAELVIYQDIKERKYGNLHDAGLNSKAFFRAKELEDKLRAALLDVVTFGSTGDENSILLAYIAGSLDRVFGNEGYYERGHDDKNYILDQGSLCLGYKFAIGVPTQIEFKNKWGGTDTLNLIKMAVTASIDSEIFQQMLEHFSWLVEESSWSDFEGRVTAYNEHVVGHVYTYTKKSFAGISCGITNVEDDAHPDYKQLKEEYELRYLGYTEEERRERESQKNILVGDQMLPVEYKNAGQSAYVTITVEQLFNLVVDELKLDDGRTVIISCKGTNRKDIKGMQLYIDQELIYSAKWDYRYELLNKPGRRKFEEICSLIEKLGEVDIYRSKYTGQKVTVFLGLEGKQSLKLASFDTQEKANAATDNALKEWFKEYCTFEFREKAFRVKVKSKTYFTLETTNLYAKFMEEVAEFQELMEKDSFEEVVTLVQAVYTDCMAKVEHEQVRELRKLNKKAAS